MKSTEHEKPPQFGIRHLLIAMFVVAVASAVLAPWLRDLTTGQWLRLGLRLSLIAAVFSLTLFLIGRSRKNAVERVREPRWEVAAKVWGQGRWQRAHGIIALGFAAWFLILFSAIELAEDRMLKPLPTSRPLPNARPVIVFFLLINATQAGLFAALGAAQLRWRPDRLLIGNEGIALWNRFTPKQKLKYFYEAGRQPTPLMIKGTGFALELEVPAEIEPALVEFLQAHYEKWDGPPRKA